MVWKTSIVYNAQFHASHTISKQDNYQLIAHRHHLDPIHLPSGLFQDKQRVIVAEILETIHAYRSAKRPISLWLMIW